MKNIHKIGFLISLLFTTLNIQAKDCLKEDKINYDLSFLSKDSILDQKSMVNDFKNGVKCFLSPTYNKTGTIKTEYTLNNIKHNYLNLINFGEQAYFFNAKIPENSILYSHQTIPVLLFQEQYLDKNDIGDYYLAFETTQTEHRKESIKTTYHSPYDFFKISIQLVEDKVSNTIVYEFNSRKDIKLLKEKVENHFLRTVNLNKLPLKLENKENMEVMRIYINEYSNSLVIVEPFIQLFLDHIDYNKLNFSKNTKMELIDKIYTEQNEINPLTIFGKDILISYTFDKKRDTGLIAFSFLKDKNVINNIRQEFNNQN